MTKVVVFLFLFIVIVPLIRMVLGVIVRSLATFLGSGIPRTASATVPASGELKRDPVCGTFVSTATSVQQTIQGEVFHFCSPACRDKFSRS